MATGWGIDHLTVNGQLSGTSSEDVRRIWAGLYSPGVVSGCGVTTSASAMTYTVAPGVAVIKIANGENVLVPVPGATLTAAPNNTGSARIDTIYVVQNMGTLNTVSLGVAQGTPIPQYSQALAVHSATAGATTTSRSYFQGSIPYSVPYGANLGLFYQKTDTSTANIPKGTATTIAAGSFNLMTDRKCIFAADLCVSSRRPNNTAAVGFDNTAYISLKIDVVIDGVTQFMFETPGLSQAWATYHCEEYVNLKSGPHTVQFKYNYGDGQGPGLVRRYYAGSDASTGSTFSVRDGGFWESGVTGDTV